MSLLNKSGLSPGIDVGIDEVGDLANLRLELEGLKADQTANVAASGVTSPTPAATFWVTYRPYKDGVKVTLRHAVDPNTAELHIVIEQYVDDGGGGIDVVDTKRDTIKITPDILSVVGGVTVIEREFFDKLEQNATYGLLRYSAKINGVKREVYAPEKDPPVRASRVVGDYITTFNSTNGEVVARQDSSPFNLIKNGRFEYVDDAPAPVDQLRNWIMKDSGWTTTVIDSTNTDDIFHDAANGAAVWQDKDKYLVQSVSRQLRRSQLFTVALDLTGSSAFTFDLTWDVVIQSSGVSDVVATVTQSFDLTTTSQRIHAVLQMKSTFDASTNHMMKFSTTTALNNDGGGGTGRTVKVQVVMGNIGRHPSPFVPHVNDVNRSGGTDPDVTVTAVMPSNDIGEGVIPTGTGAKYVTI